MFRSDSWTQATIEFFSKLTKRGGKKYPSDYGFLFCPDLA
jgi:hypothetical protein